MLKLYVEPKQCLKNKKRFLTSASPATTICSPQYLLPPPTVIRQKRFFLFKKNAHDFLSTISTPSAIFSWTTLAPKWPTADSKTGCSESGGEAERNKALSAEGKSTDFDDFFSEIYVYFDFEGKIFRHILPIISN